MKAIIQFSSMVACMILSLNIATATELTLKYKYEYTKSFALGLKEMQNQAHTIKIKDQNDFVFFSEKVEGQTSFSKMYNLENLPKGKYFLVVENNEKIITQLIWANERFLSIDNQNQSIILKPTIAVAETFVDINMLYFQKDKVAILLKDAEGNVIYNDHFKTCGSLNKRFNINDLPKGNYQIAIQTNLFSVSEHFEVGKEKMLFAGSF